MHPILWKFNFFGSYFQINSYSFFMILASLNMIFVIWKAMKAINKKKYDILIIIITLLSSAILGARLLDVIANSQLYSNDIQKIFSFKASGFSLTGALILSAISALIITKLLKVNIWLFADNIIFGLGFSIILMRIGCFLNGCCFGKITNLPWGVSYPDISQPAIYYNNIFLSFNHKLHPTQIYEIIYTLLGMIITYYLKKRKIREGVSFLTFGLWFISFHWLNEIFRVEKLTMNGGLYLYPSLYFFIFVLLFCLLIKKICLDKSNL